jgi:hypothetical protein
LSSHRPLLSTAIGDPPYSGELPTSSTIPSSLSSVELQQLLSKFENLEISKCIPGHLSESSNQFENTLCLGIRYFHHKASSSKSSTMEDDCEENNKSSSSNDMHDIPKRIALLLAQITSQTTKLSNDFHQVVNNTDAFKQEVRSEIDELRSLIWEMKKPTTSSSSSRSRVLLVRCNPPVHFKV